MGVFHVNIDELREEVERGSARVPVERLVRSGMYLSSRVIEDALELVGE